MSRLKKLWTLFTTTFLISMSANSGFAMLSVMKNTFVERYGWFSDEEMSDYIALAQSAPGPIGINASVIVGYQSAGMSGVLSAVAGCALPPLLIMIMETFFYNRIIDNKIAAAFLKGMQYGVAAMLLDVIISLFVNVTRKGLIYPVIVIVISFLYINYSDYSIFFLALACLLAGLVKAMIMKKSKENI